MSDPAVEPATETAAERRARLRRMRVLGNSENRMKLILEGQKLDTAASTPTSPLSSSSSTCDNADSSPEYPVYTSQYDQSYTPPEPDTFSSRESESLPRKVSMISSPIDYKTLQRSQENNARVNNYLNTFQVNIATPTIVLVIILAMVSSFVHLNIPTVFFTFEAIKYAITFQLDAKKGSFVKELTTFVFVYAMFQALMFMLR